MRTQAACFMEGARRSSEGIGLPQFRVTSMQDGRDHRHIKVLYTSMVVTVKHESSVSQMISSEYTSVVWRCCVDPYSHTFCPTYHPPPPLFVYFCVPFQWLGLQGAVSRYCRGLKLCPKLCFHTSQMCSVILVCVCVRNVWKFATSTMLL